jgi:hypothetical protein
MKNILSLICLGLITIGITANAQQFRGWSGEQVVIAGGTNNLVGNDSYGTISNYPPYNAWIDVPKAENVVLYFGFKGTQATNAASTVWTFQRTPEHGRYATNNKIVITIPATGVATNVYSTNISLSGFPYLFLESVGNSNVQHITNLYFSYGFKN